MSRVEGMGWHPRQSLLLNLSRASTSHGRRHFRSERRPPPSGGLGHHRPDNRKTPTKCSFVTPGLPTSPRRGQIKRVPGSPRDPCRLPDHPSNGGSRLLGRSSVSGVTSSCHSSDRPKVRSRPPLRYTYTSGPPGLGGTGTGPSADS